MKYSSAFAVCLMTAFQISPAPQPQVPTVNADNTSVVHPPKPLEPGVKGYGTRGVEGRTLGEMIASCQLRTRLSNLQIARCDQLRRSLKAQPDGTLDETLKQGK
jgi:hypothetical protein